MSEKLTGIIASQGIAIGKAYKFIKEKVDVERTVIGEDQIDLHKKQIQGAIEKYKNDLQSRKVSSEEEQGVINAHTELLSDPYLIDTIETKIETEKVAADWALQETVGEMVAMMESLDDEYLKERAADYKDIGQQLMYALKGITPKNLSNLEEDCIIISDELTPSDTSTMKKKHVLGFAMDFGGKTSHTSIIAQTLGIPAMVGMGDVTEKVEDGDYLVLDAEHGFLMVNPEPEVVKEYEEKLAALQAEAKRLEQVKDKKAVTKDGRKVEVSCNIGNLEDLERGLEMGADGVGLFRTEFLYMENTHFPTEEEQFEVYKEATVAMEGKMLIVRTLDIGGDKSLPYYTFPVEENPFLGWRALRISFDLPDMFRAQLRAILRASAYGNIKVLLPMVISVDELKKVRELLDECKEELRKEGHDFNEDLEVGVMVETPASVMIAEDLIQYADFFSIGTNDLTQYILAVDRGNQNISKLYNTYNPAVLRAIARVIKASHEAGKWTGMCGGFAGDTNATYLLLGMGLDEFSCPASRIAKVKDIILNSNMDEAKAFAEKVLSMSELKDIEEAIQANENK